MGLDERFFAQLYRHYKKLIGPGKPELSPNAVELTRLDRRLELLLNLLCGSRIPVRPSDDEGGLEGAILFLPAHCDRFGSEEKNLLFYLHRIAWTALVLNRALASPPPETEAELRELFETEYPEAHTLFAPLWSEYYSTPPETRTPRFFFGKAPMKKGEPQKEALPSATLSSPETGQTPPPTLKAKTAHKPESLELKSEEQNPVIHAFEKVQTAEEYTGSNRQKDGSNELEEHAEALNELKLNRVIRTRETTKSVIHSDAWIESPQWAGGSEPDATSKSVHHYPEWNERKRSYLENWCTLYEGTVALDPGSQGSAPRSPELRRRLETLRNKLAVQKRQIEGDELDIDAVTSFWSDPTLRKTISSPKIYTRRRNLNRDWSTLILVDGSLSTDAWVENQRVMDVIKSGVAKVCEPLDALSADFAVAAFHSNTRKECHFDWIKGFSEDWKKGYPRLQSLRPQGYTRIGPAIRHATRLLKDRDAKTKLILLLSDSKPSDFDPYEGNHGVFDVKMSVQEAHAHSILVRSISVTRNPHSSFSTMYGRNGFEHLSHPREFEARFTRIFERLLK